MGDRSHDYDDINSTAAAAAPLRATSHHAAPRRAALSE